MYSLIHFGALILITTGIYFFFKNFNSSTFESKILDHFEKDEQFQSTESQRKRRKKLGLILLVGGIVLYAINAIQNLY
jgi:hypothetical protein